jgi:hypothetical protein
VKDRDNFIYCNYLLRIERHLLENYDVEVVYGSDVSDAYYESARVVEISSRQNMKSRLHSLLHEAGHVVLRNEHSRIRFGENFPFMRKRGCSVRGDKKHRADVLREEVMAWEKGRDLASTLGITIDSDAWNKHRQNSLISYMEWF